MHYYAQRHRVSTLADVLALEAAPIESRRLPASTYEMLANAARAFPDKIAIHHIGDGDEFRRATSVTYAELLAGITQTANLLHGLGVGPGDVVGILTPNTIEGQYAIWGAEAAGIACSVNWMLDPDIIADLLRSAGAKVLIAFGPHPDFDIWDKVEQLRRRLPELTALVAMGGGPVDDPRVVAFAAERARHRADALVSGRVFRPGDTASLFHTGGTTGTPKLARHTHGNEVFMSWVTAVQQDVEPDDVRVLAVPLFHVTGVLTHSLMPLSRGATIVMLTAGGWRDPTVARNIWGIIEHYRITSMSLVPSVVGMLLNIPIRGADIGSLQVVSSGTAPLSVAVSKAFRDLTGAVVVEAYGLTETTALCASNPRHGETRIGSVGLRFAYERLKTAVLDRDGRWLRDCAPGESGIVVVSGPNVFPGYLDARHDAGSWAADGWLNTGDVGYVDADGYCFLTGRAKDLIIRGGNNIDPRLIEEAFYAHPLVADAAAVGMPDAHAGELPVVFVTAKPGARLSVPRLKFHAYEAIPERAAVPKAIYVVDALPKTAVGKVRKNDLRLDTVRRAQIEALSEIVGIAGIEVAVSTLPDGRTHSDIALRAAAGHPEAALRRDADEALLRFTSAYDLRIT